MSHCNRCDWQHTPDTDGRPREQLQAHALDAGHPLCVICHRSRHRDEQQTCEHDLTRAREILAGIVLMQAELPRHLGHLRGSTYDNDRPSSNGQPLPGGDILVLLGPGSTGTAARTLTRTEQAAGLSGREHGIDNDPLDGMSVAFTLWQWVADWKETRR